MAETATEVRIVQVRYYCESMQDGDVCGQEMYPNSNFAGPEGPDRFFQHECSRGHREFLKRRYPALVPETESPADAL